MLHLETLWKHVDKFDDHRHLFSTVEYLLRVQAVVAGSAVFLLICFAEVVEKQLSAACVGLGV